jgi:hypothetical protein
MDYVEYGQWCTVGNTRYMIISGTKNGVNVHTSEGARFFDKSVVTEISDFYITDRERQELGYAF